MTVSQEKFSSEPKKKSQRRMNSAKYANFGSECTIPDFEVCLA